jgi:DNA-binding transcriptional regulator YiaG
MPNFDDLPKNPLRKLREDRDLNIAQAARLAKIQQQVVRDAEAGLLRTIPTKLASLFMNTIQETILDRQYNDWQKLKRNMVKLPPVGDLSISSDHHPLKQYRDKLQLAVPNFCNYLCVPRFVVMHYEIDQIKMPKVLKYEALPQANLSKVDIARLAILGETFYMKRIQESINARKVNNG